MGVCERGFLKLLKSIVLFSTDENKNVSLVIVTLGPRIGVINSLVTTHSGFNGLVEDFVRFVLLII